MQRVLHFEKSRLSFGSVLYEGARCGTRLTSEELSQLRELNCINWGNQILKKSRVPVVKEIKRADRRNIRPMSQEFGRSKGEFDLAVSFLCRIHPQCVFRMDLMPTAKCVTGYLATTQTARERPTRVPSELATPTDLTEAESRAVIAALNPLIADAFALYVKTKNFHWHLYGSHFRDYHLLFDEQAQQIFGSTDVLAERVRRVGGATIRSIGHIHELQTIEDDDDQSVPAGEMVRRLMEDNAHITKNIRDAISVCDKNRDSASSNILQELLDETEKRKWFLFEITQGVRNTE
jgi:starvation-inducible DNA-binding protein